MSKQSEETVLEFAIRHTRSWIATSKTMPWSSFARTAGSAAIGKATSGRNTTSQTDSLQDLQGEMASCRNCKTLLHIAPVVMLHDQDEKRRFEAVFAEGVNVN